LNAVAVYIVECKVLAQLDNILI